MSLEHVMTLQQLRNFLAVVSQGGYRAAARALGVSQAGLTKSLAGLEEQCGVALLERSSRGVFLTVAGEELAMHARALLSEAERTEECMQRLSGPPTKRVQLGVSVDPSLSLAPAVLKDFRKAFPDVAVHLTQRSSSELLAAIRDNSLDLAITRLPGSFEPADLTVHRLYEGRGSILVRKGHPFRDVGSLRDLSDCEWVVVGNPAIPGLQDESIRELFFQQRLGRPRIAAVSDSLFGAVSMLLESDCVARLPLQLLRHPMARDALAEIRVREPINLAYQVGVLFKAGRRLGREATHLVAMVRSFSRLIGFLGASEASP